MNHHHHNKELVPREAASRQRQQQQQQPTKSRAVMLDVFKYMLLFAFAGGAYKLTYNYFEDNISKDLLGFRVESLYKTPIYGDLIALKTNYEKVTPNMKVLIIQLSYMCDSLFKVKEGTTKIDYVSKKTKARAFSYYDQALTYINALKEETRELDPPKIIRIDKLLSSIREEVNSAHTFISRQ